MIISFLIVSWWTHTPLLSFFLITNTSFSSLIQIFSSLLLYDPTPFLSEFSQLLSLKRYKSICETLKISISWLFPLTLPLSSFYLNSSILLLSFYFIILFFSFFHFFSSHFFPLFSLYPSTSATIVFLLWPLLFLTLV